MGKGTKIVYSLLNEAMKPLYNQMKKENRELEKLHEKRMSEVDKMIDAHDRNWQHRSFEVHQMYDSAIHEDEFW